MAMREAGLVASGVALIGGAIALLLVRAPAGIVALALAFGVGVCVSAQTFVKRARTRAVVLLIVVVGFFAYRLGVLVADGVTWSRAAVLAVQTLMLAVALAVAYDRAHGLAQLSALFRGADAGYAPVLDEPSATRIVEAELARSRRRGTPLTFLLLEPTPGAAVPEFRAAVERVATAALAELGEVFARERACELIAEHGRRSDVVVCSEHRFLVMSSDTDAEGTAILAERMVEAAKQRLGVTLRQGMAEFPTHGSSYRDLIDVASEAAHAPPPPPAPATPAPTLSAAQVPNVRATP
jgi:hypothetical protein